MSPADRQAHGRRWFDLRCPLLPGMLVCEDGYALRCVYVLPFGQAIASAGGTLETITIGPSTWIDLADPATEGAAMHHVRTLWESPHAYLRQAGSVLRPGTTPKQHDHIPAWEVCDLWLSETRAASLGVRRGSVKCWGFLSAADAIIGAVAAIVSDHHTPTIKRTDQ